ncbi:hypothetical protein GQ457_15G010010 [Hibiscus cannabinus]
MQLLHNVAMNEGSLFDFKKYSVLLLDLFWLFRRFFSDSPQLSTDCIPTPKVVLFGFHLTVCWKLGSMMIRPISTSERGACLRMELSQGSGIKLSDCLYEPWCKAEEASAMLLAFAAAMLFSFSQFRICRMSPRNLDCRISLCLGSPILCKTSSSCLMVFCTAAFTAFY